ncbi:hypothetical protein HKX48_004599 [Thoreauomyces humboldtii]|nr:hypothetical protein HKX48_004599 [Thoreauomyces humboldtii]
MGVTVLESNLYWRLAKKALYMARDAESKEELLRSFTELRDRLRDNHNLGWGGRNWKLSFQSSRNWDLQFSGCLFIVLNVPLYDCFIHLYGEAVDRTVEGEKLREELGHWQRYARRREVTLEGQLDAVREQMKRFGAFPHLAPSDGRKVDLETANADLGPKLARSGIRVADLETSEAKLKRGLETLLETKEALSHSLSEATARAVDLEAANTALTGDLRRSGDRIAALETSEATIRDDIRSARTEHDRAKMGAASHAEEAATHSRTLQESGEAAVQIEWAANQVQALEGKLASARSELETKLVTAETALADAVANLTATQNENSALVDNLARANERRMEVEEANNTLTSTLGRAMERQAELGSDLAATEAREATLQTNLFAVQEQNGVLAANLAELNVKLLGLEVQQTSLQQSVARNEKSAMTCEAEHQSLVADLEDSRIACRALTEDLRKATREELTSARLLRAETDKLEDARDEVDWLRARMAGLRSRFLEPLVQQQTSASQTELSSETVDRGMQTADEIAVDLGSMFTQTEGSSEMVDRGMQTADEIAVDLESRVTQTEVSSEMVDRGMQIAEDPTSSDQEADSSSDFEFEEIY